MASPFVEEWPQFVCKEERLVASGSSVSVSPPVRHRERSRREFAWDARRRLVERRVETVSSRRLLNAPWTITRGLAHITEAILWKSTQDSRPLLRSFDGVGHDVHLGQGEAEDSDLAGREAEIEAN